MLPLRTFLKSSIHNTLLIWFPRLWLNVKQLSCHDQITHNFEMTPKCFSVSSNGASLVAPGKSFIAYSCLHVIWLVLIRLVMLSLRMQKCFHILTFLSISCI